ncbi:MAG: tetratricopeptide repeat protein [Bacteroidetes bacterium]|nr:tetratricopeptide repeat protein [Bacteroidota bacterium]
MKLFPLLLLLFLASTVRSQDEVLAKQYYQNGEFEKAAVVYEKIYSRRYEDEIYENYFQSLLALKKYEEAQKLAKKQSKHFDSNLNYVIDQGYVLVQATKLEKADIYFTKLINEKHKEASYYLVLAAAFVHRELYDYAKKTYLTAREKLENENLFQSELATLYAETDNKEGTINEFLNLLDYNEGMLDYVQNMLQNYLTQSKDFDMLKSALNKRSSRNPDRIIYAELLEWLLVQQKNWDAAFIQAKAIDKRMGTQGDECMRIAFLCMENNAYTSAYSIYQYVISLGKYKAHYLSAREGLLNTASKKTFYSGTYTTADLTILKQDYLTFLTEFGSNESTANIMKELAQLEAFYLDDKEGASDLLNQIILLGNIGQSFKAECKLLLGDIKLLSGDEWEAALLYGQVDKDFKEDPLGQEAKFRNAKLSFYQGEFLWAQAQLDILKTATSQLISNNAIDLSLLIQDHTVDSNYEPLSMYAAAELFIYQNKYSEALNKLDSITLLFPSHSLTDVILFAKGKLMAKQHNYSKACDYYKQVYEKAPEDILADNALWELAQIYEKSFNDLEQAKHFYEELILKYPGSFFTAEARKRFRQLRGDTLD